MTFILYFATLKNMDITANNIIPITKARSRLSTLTKRVSSDKYIVLTKGGTPSVALVDIDYLTKLQNTVRKLYKKTFIDKKLILFTRALSDKEIREWEKEDIL